MFERAKNSVRTFSWKLPKQKSTLAPDYVWSNSDQDPVEPSRRTWSGYTFVLYWFSDLVTYSTWANGAAVVALGLSPSDAIWIVFVAAMCNAIPTVMNGAIGADLHIPFPIAVRASYGYWLAYFCVVSRGILALFWFGVQSSGGATAITQMITAIWPSYALLHNSLPASAGITTKGMISYFIYHVVQTPFLFIKTEKLKWMFLTKTILVPPMALAMVIYLAVAARHAPDFWDQKSTVTGSARAWLWLSSMTSITGGFSTLAVNIPDFARFAKKPGSQVWQLPFIPIFKILVSIFGVVGAAASKPLYGKVLWSPLDILAEWQGSHGGRAAAFFCAALWCLAQICVNISANSVSFGNDITSLFPKYFNIRRGVIFAMLVGGFGMVPWIILSNAKTFLNFMSAYAVFMAPIAAIMLTDYWFIKRRKIDVPALYDPEGIYGKCVRVPNWRSLAIMILVIVPMLPALANKVTPKNVHIPIELSHLFAINWLYGFVASCVLYYVLNVVFPDRKTLIPEVIHGDTEIVEGVGSIDQSSTDGAEGRAEKGFEAKEAQMSTMDQ
ncbi:putative permease [Lachnellula subtilissima]|uniref:Putative permease n=1 Tax=Lachnellula subtilissima TaxID=602034 RepID=A0A8H8S086_9HELO|nr:putative permease [Lachnellula subtilissima]